MPTHATSRPLLALVLVATAPFALAACTFSSNLTVPPDEVATLAEDSLEEQIGQRPDIDCGTEQIDVVQGNEITCLLTDPATGEQYDTAVLFSSVDGASYSIDVQVADVPS